MIYLIILLSLIIVLLSLTIKIEIKKLEISYNKIKYNIYIYFFVFRFIKIFSKKIRKKDIEKLLDRIFKRGKTLKINNIFFSKNKEFSIDNLFIKIEYGWENIFQNIFLYAFLNSIIPTTLNKVKSKHFQKYIIKTDFNKNYLNIKIKTTIKIQVFKILSRIITSQY